jgi:cyclopropane-fatty-acyl-phospholipid synthase
MVEPKAGRAAGRRITAISNPHSQGEWIEARAPSNVRVLTGDVNELALEGGFDRIVTIEMLEHVRNYEALMLPSQPHVSLRPRLDGPHLLHRGTMLSADLLPHLAHDLRIVDRWFVDGAHYARTVEEWLGRLQASEAELRRRFGRAFVARWRVFLIACAELWGYREGSEWLVAHYLFEPAHG